MKQEFEKLQVAFQCVLQQYREAETHDEKVQLVKIAKEIVAKSRRQLTRVPARIANKKGGR